MNPLSNDEFTKRVMLMAEPAKLFEPTALMIPMETA